MSTRLSPECRALLEEISAYLDGELDATACDAIERHCRECAHCADFVEGLQATIGLCRRAANTPLPEAVRKRAMVAVRELLASAAPRGEP